MKKLLIAEFSEEIYGFLEYCRAHGWSAQEFLVVALQAEVQVRCKQEGLNYIDTLPFFKTESHIRVLEKSHELTSLISKKLSFNIEDQVEKVLIDTFIFYSRFYLNNYLWIIEVLEGIKKENGENGKNGEDLEIYVYRRPMSPGLEAARRSPYLVKKDRYLHIIVETYCRVNRMKIQVLEKPETGGTGEKKNSEGLIKKCLKYAAAKLYRMKVKALSHSPVVFTAAPSYNLDRVTRDLQAIYPNMLAVTDYHLPGGMTARGYVKLCLLELRDRLTGRKYENQLIAVPVDLFAPHSAKVKKSYLNQVKEAFEKFAAQHREQFEYAGCSFWEEFRGKVEEDLLEALAGLLNSSLARRAFLENLRPQLVLSPVSTAEYQDWARVSYSLEIPALVIPQKTLLKPANSHAAIEEYYIGRAQVTDTFANVAAQSPLVTEYLRWSGYKGHILETGNLIFARLTPEKRKERREKFFKEIGGHKKIIVWAPSMKTRKSRRFYVLESIDELLSAMEDVFNAVSKMDDVHLVFRIHPGDAITKAEIYSLLPVPANVSVSDSGSYEDVLALADLLISYSSTAVQEALINYIPVLFYDKWHRYNHLGVAEIGSPTPAETASAYYLHKKEYLESSIKWILNEHSQTTVPGELFKNYIFLDTEQAIQNFSDFVNKCLKNQLNQLK